MSPVVLTIVMCSSVLAQDMPVSPEAQYSLFVRILTFDRTLHKKDSARIVIGVLYQEGVKISLEAKDDFMAAVAQSNIKEIAGRPIECIPLAIRGSTLPTRASQDSIEILYVTPVRAFDIASLARAMDEAKILTMTGVPEYVQDGIAIGIGTRGDKPSILINLYRAKSQGADLSAQLLRLATIVE